MSYPCFIYNEKQHEDGKEQGDHKNKTIIILV